MSGNHVDHRGHQLIDTIRNRVRGGVDASQVSDRLQQHLSPRHLDERFGDEIARAARIERISPKDSLLGGLGVVMRLVVHHQGDQRAGVDEGVERVSGPLTGQPGDLVDEAVVGGGDGETRPL